MNILSRRYVGTAALIATMTGVTMCGLAASAHASQDSGTQAINDGMAALAQARQYEEQRNWQAAADAYARALSLMPGNQEAINGRQLALQMLNQGDMLDEVTQEREVIRQRTMIEFDNAFARAQSQLNQELFDDALNTIIQAKVKLDRGRPYLSEVEYVSREQAAGTLQDDIAQSRREVEEQERIDQIEQTRRDAERERERERQERQAMIQQNLLRVRQLQQELKYDAALQVIDEILFIDELNPTALVLRDAITTNKMYRDYVETIRQRELGLGRLNQENQESMVPPKGIIDYPADWPQISRLRTGANGWVESPANQRVSQILGETRIPVDFQGNTVAQVLNFIEDVTDVTIYADWKALDFEGVRPNDPIDLQLGETTVASALERVLEQLGDGYSTPPQFAIQDGYVVVSSDEALRRNKVTVVYDIRDLLFEVPYFDNAPDFNVNAALNQGSGGRGTRATSGGGAGGGFGGGEEGSAAGNIFGEPDQEADRPEREELVEQIRTIIEDTVDPDGWRNAGGSTGSMQELNGNLIITNTPQNHAQIEGLLSELREIRAIQVNVEGRFLAVSTDWFEQIGVDLDLYFDVNSDVRTQQLAADPLSHLSDLFDTSPGGRGRLIDPFFYGQVVDADGNVVANRIPFGNTVGIPTGVDGDGDGFGDLTYVVGPVGQPIRATDGFAPFGVIQNSFDPENGLVNTLAEFDAASFAGLATSVSPALSLGIQFLDDIQVDLLIEATQADRRSVVLTAPRLTLFNGQRAWVAVARQEVYVSGLTPVTGDASGAFEPQTDVLFDGFVLDVEAVVSADRRYVTMNVIAEQSEILAIEQKGPFGGAAGGGGLTGGSDSFEGFIEAPVIQVQLVYTTVSVPDKGTILLGGQRKVSEVEVEAGVPVLSKIPFINRFFTNRVTAKSEETLLILIRPEIIIQQEKEDLLFPGLRDQIGGAAAYLP